MTSRETENNAYAKFWADKQRALWYVIVFSGVANLQIFDENLGLPPLEKWSCFEYVKMTFFVV